MVRSASHDELVLVSMSTAPALSIDCLLDGYSFNLGPASMAALSGCLLSPVVNDSGRFNIVDHSCEVGIRRYSMRGCLDDLVMDLLHVV